ncbi:hypothetical protein [Alishewanella phage vB_AspM_Slickus01]|nr:hypothetical protein [Alishewanella phage vB_AspM_Slicko01]WGH49751.1 hypothetical protein [Alishewanella phage vB_AspM_Slickus01]
MTPWQDNYFVVCDEPIHLKELRGVDLTAYIVTEYCNLIIRELVEKNKK